MQPNAEIMKIKNGCQSVNRCLLHSATMFVDAMLILPKRRKKQGEMSPSAETVKLVKCLPKLTFKKAIRSAGKSDNRQIPATAVSKTSGGKYTPN